MLKFDADGKCKILMQGNWIPIENLNYTYSLPSEWGKIMYECQTMAEEDEALKTQGIGQE